MPQGPPCAVRAPWAGLVPFWAMPAEPCLALLAQASGPSCTVHAGPRVAFGPVAWIQIKVFFLFIWFKFRFKPSKIHIFLSKAAKIMRPVLLDF
jgi:hypothetical protein